MILVSVLVVPVIETSGRVSVEHIYIRYCYVIAFNLVDVLDEEDDVFLNIACFNNCYSCCMTVH